MVELFIMDTRCFADKELFAETYKTLSEYRRNKIDSYLYDKDKYLSMGAGYLFEQGLKKFNMPQQYGSVSYGKFGKPKLKTKDRVYNFNISHSGIYSVCAFSSGEVGVDIQIMSDVVSDKLIKTACTPLEQVYLAGLDEQKRRSEFFRMWTVKESFMKYIGAGLSVSPLAVRVELNPTITVWLNGKKQDAFFKEYNLDGYKLTVCSGTNEFANTWREVKIPTEVKPEGN